jgi:RNA-directed DNA polymerase
MKTLVMTSAGRQRLLGVVVNERTNVARREYDALRATLYNCARFGSESQHRNSGVDLRAHLLGRIEWVATTNPQRGQKLAALFREISWP